MPRKPRKLPDYFTMEEAAKLVQATESGDTRLAMHLSPNPPMGGVKARQVGMREPTREKAWAPWGPM